MKSNLKKIGLVNLIAIIILLSSWGSVFFIHGMASAIAWTLLKVLYPLLGLFWLAVNIALVFWSVIKKRKCLKGKSLLSIMLSIILLFPVLFLTNIIPFAYPSSIEKMRPAITVQSPFDESAVVGWGGDTIEDNYHAAWSAERWAYDLVMEPYDIASAELSDYGIWNKSVYSPVSGTVVAAYDDEEDIQPNLEEFKSSAGNYIYIEIEVTGTYLILCHFKQDSIEVEAGDHVAVGDYLGRVGNSGATSEPHLHIHHQKQDPTKVHTLFSEGLPLYFENGENSGMVIKNKKLESKNK